MTDGEKDSIRLMRETAERCLADEFERFSGMYVQLLGDYESVLRNAETAVTQCGDSDGTSSSVIDELLSFLADVKKWLVSIDDFRSLITEDAPVKRVHEALLNKLEDFPGKLTKTVPDSFWKRSAGDPFVVSLGKISRYSLIRSKRAADTAANSVYRLFGRPAKMRPDIQRTFSLHDFVHFHMILPAEKTLDTSLQLLLKHLSDRLGSLHESADSFYHVLSVLSINNEDSEVQAESSVDASVVYNEHLTMVRSFLDEAPGVKDSAYEKALEMLNATVQAAESRFETAGTFILPSKTFDSAATVKQTKLSADARSRKAVLWDLHLTGEKEDWLKDVTVSMLRLESEKACRTSIDTITASINDTIVSALDYAVSLIDGTLESPALRPAEQEGEIADSVRLESKNLLNNLREQAIPRIMDAVLSANIEKNYQSYMRSINALVEMIEDELVIFELRDFDNTPPHSKIGKIVLKDIIGSEMTAPLLNRHAKTADDIHTRIEQSFRAISEIEQIVEYNMNAALNMAEEPDKPADGESTGKILIEGIERARTQILELRNGFITIIELAEQQLVEMTRDLTTGLQELADNNAVFDLKLRLAKARAREKLRSSTRHAWHRTVTTVRSTLPFAHKTLSGAVSWYKRFMKMTGMAVAPSGVDVRLAEYLKEASRRIEQLPYIYQRLFSMQPLTDRRFFSSRDDEMQKLKSAFELRMKGTASSTAIIGERGSGKTTILNFAENDIFPHLTVVKIQFGHDSFEMTVLAEQCGNAFGISDAASLDELEQQIAAREGLTVCICENLHNLFIRTVDGFDTIERFLLFMQRTEVSVFWIVTCALYSWRYLNHVIHISRYFSAVIELGSEERSEIEETILKRHRISGYLLSFDVPPLLEKSRAYRRLSTPEDRQAFIRQRFFDQLAELAAGNIRVALLFWLMAIKEIGKDRMVISSEIEFDHSFVYGLPPDELFTLAAVLQHESLTYDQHASIFRNHLQDSMLILNRMARVGLLEEKEGVFSIHPFMYRPVVKALQSKNIIQ